MTHTEHKDSQGSVPVMQDGTQRPQIYELRAPPWRPLLHPGSHLLGKPDVYPPKPGQIEDVLSEQAVKNGISGRSVVSNETFSAHDMIHDRLKGNDTTSQLGSIFEEVLLRRQQLMKLRCGSATSQYRQPQRVTLNESKLAAYIKDLADANVPLRKLARSVPHGYRGERMLDMLWMGGAASSAAPSRNLASGLSHQMPLALPNSIAIERAVWFVRVVGASENASFRSKQSGSTSYTTEWTSLFMSWLHKQLNELVISPGSNTPVHTPSPSLNRPSQQTQPHNHLLDENYRARWLSKWQYSLQLLRAISREGMIDLFVAARYAIDILRKANPAQMYISLGLVQGYMDVIVKHPLATQHALEVLVRKHRELQPSSSHIPSLRNLCEEMGKLVSHCFELAPHFCILPAFWPSIQTIILEHDREVGLTSSFQLVHIRNTNLQSCLLKEETDQHSCSPDMELLRDVQILDETPVVFTIQQCADSLARPGLQSLSQKVRTIIIWSTTKRRYGCHRPFMAASLVQLMSGKRTTHRTSSDTDVQFDERLRKAERIDVDTIVMNFITELDTALRPQSAEDEQPEPSHNILLSISIDALIVLLGELCRKGCFSFQKYMQRLTARGLTATSWGDTRSGETSSVHSSSETLHTRLLRSIPVYSTSAPLFHQRRNAIYGNRTKESFEEAMERRAARDLLSALPWLHQQKVDKAAVTDLSNKDPRLVRLWSCSRYVRTKIIRNHVAPCFTDPKWMQALDPLRLMDLIVLLVDAEDYPTLWDLLEPLLEQNRHPISKTAKRGGIQHLLLWKSMNLSHESLRQLHCSSVEASEEFSGVPDDVPDDGRLTIWKESLRVYFDALPREPSRDIRQGVIDCFKTQAGQIALFDAVIYAAKKKNWSAQDILESTKAFVRVVGSLSDTSFDKAVLVWLMNIQTREDASPACHLSAALVCLNMASYAHLLDSFVIPTLTRSWSSSEKASASAFVGVQLGIELIQAEMIDREGSQILKSEQARYLSSETVSQLALTAARLGALQANEHAVDLAEEINELRRSITALPLFHVYFQSYFQTVAQQVCHLGDYHGVLTFFTDMFPSFWLASFQEEQMNFGELFADLDAWRWNQKLVEVSMLVTCYEKGQTPAQEGASSKLHRVAKLFSERFSTHDGESAVRQLLSLMPSHSPEFMSALVDEKLRRLNVSLEAPITDELMVGVLVRNAMCLIQEMSDKQLSLTNVTLQTLRLVADWFESRDALSPIPDEDCSAEQLSKQLRRTMETAYARSGVLCLLLKFQNLLTSTAAKTIAPRIYRAMLEFILSRALYYNCPHEEVQPLLDTVTYFHQNASPDLQLAMQKNAFERLTAIAHPNLFFSSGTAKRVMELANAPSTHAISPCASAPLRPEAFIEAQSNTAAFVGRHYTPFSAKPWEWHPNIDTMRADSDASAAHFYPSSELWPLLNNGPISLSLFGAYRTLDRIPSSEAPQPLFGSEADYGLHQGGESVFARDVKRGLLALGPMNEKRSGRRNFELDEKDVMQLVPALRPSLEARGFGEQENKTQRADAPSTPRKRKEGAHVDSPATPSARQQFPPKASPLKRAKKS